MKRRSTTGPIVVHTLEQTWLKQVAEAQRRQDEWIAQAEAKRLNTSPKTASTA